MAYRQRAARISALLVAVSSGLLCSGEARAQAPAPSVAKPLPPLPPLPVDETSPSTPPIARPVDAQTPAVTVERPDSSEPSPSAQVFATPRAVSPDQSFDDVRYRDAHADRVILGSTAETHPAGTLFLTDYEIVLLQLGYAITDNVQIAFAGVPPVIGDQDYFIDLSLKVNLVRMASFRAAITGALDILTDANSDDGPSFAGRIGGIAQFCFEDHCRSSLSLSAGVAVTNATDHLVPAYGAAGLIVNLSTLVSLLVEPALGGAVSTGDYNGGSVFAMDYGIRIAGPRFGVDLTLLKPVANTNGQDFTTSSFPLGYPFVAFTYRTSGTVPLPPTFSGMPVHPGG